jgi:formamidopyrimidine-DNA glycosylase
MPELPEVNTFQRYFDETSLDQRIAEVQVHDDKIIRNVSGEAFADLLAGRTFTGSYRRGKYLFGELDNEDHVLLHFGMSGDLKYYEDAADRPKYERFAFHFDNGFKLGFDCPRKFARINYIKDLDQYLKEVKLGEDAQRISEGYFLEKTEGRRGTLKGFLLNQSHFAGVGNLYADEICYQTRVHPASVVEAIPKKKRKEIFQKMQEVLEFAVNKNAYYKDYPDDWLWQWREEGKVAPDGKSLVKSDKIGGRTTYFCEGWQKQYT